MNLNIQVIKKQTIFLLLLKALLFIFLIFPISYASTYHNSSPLFIEHWQDSLKALKVNYRLRSNNIEPIVQLRINEKLMLSPNEINLYPRESDVTAVLFLVDISDPSRQKIINKNIIQIINILKNSKKHHKFGMASFAEKLNLLSPLGSDKRKIIAKVSELKATGTETLLYQHIAGSIDLLNEFNATRRVLIVFSDGKAEDQVNVYNHDYVINKAMEKNTIIDGLAFPPRPKRVNTAHYQTLGRLASETGGTFLKATTMGDLDEDDIIELLDSSDKGGYWHFNISTLEQKGLSGDVPATLKVNYGQHQISFPLTLKLKKNQGKPAYGKVFIVITLTFLLLSLAISLLLKKKNSKNKAYAYIETLDGNNQYIITKRTYKIGRNEENDLVLANNSVSSFHAQVHVNRKNEFIITDLQSTNGIFVNGEEVTSHSLDDKDTIGIGEVRLRFSQV